MNELFTPEKDMTFLSMKDSREFSITDSGQHNYAMVNQDSHTIKGYIRMECKLHSEYHQAKGKVNETPEENSGSVVKKEKRNGKTYRMNCPAFMFFKRGDKSTWTLKEMGLEHNHPPAESLSTFAIHRRLTDEQQAQVHKLLDAKAPPRVIVDYTVCISKLFFFLGRRTMDHQTTTTLFQQSISAKTTMSSIQ
jgi:hypothetical protein